MVVGEWRVEAHHVQQRIHHNLARTALRAWRCRGCARTRTSEQLRATARLSTAELLLPSPRGGRAANIHHVRSNRLFRECLPTYCFAKMVGVANYLLATVLCAVCERAALLLSVFVCWWWWRDVVLVLVLVVATAACGCCL